MKIELDGIARLDVGDFRLRVLSAVDKGLHAVSFFALETTLFIVLADDTGAGLEVLSTEIENGTYPSLTPECTQLHLFEREIAEQSGILPQGHPRLKPVRKPDVPGEADFYRVEGSEIHEVGVGPVHAGIIEPGHFRFQCHGEHVYHLETALGYQHRGVEKLIVSRPEQNRLHFMETLAGDTSIGNAIAYSRIVEELSDCEISPRAESLRLIALELERIANHIGDLGALSGDVGFLPTASYCGRIRGDFLNMTAVLCGNRFGRGMVRPGGTGYDIDESLVQGLLERLDTGENDAANAVELMFDAPSVLARMDGTGVLPREICIELGIVGPAARASGLRRDVRISQAGGITPAVMENGDVHARAYIRWLEVQNSIAFIRRQLQELPSGSVYDGPGASKPGYLSVSLVEGWRGEVCHVALSSEDGGLKHYKITDPSFHNWAALEYSMRGGGISDFPLFNKSFNLSYCGFDL